MDNFLHNYLAKLGFDGDEIAVYASLVEFGSMSLSELSRKSKVERTALYRLIDPLQEKGLIIVQVENKRKIIQPAEISTIDRIITQKQAALDEIKTEKSEFKKMINNIAGKSTDTKVNIYRGTEGIKQVIWNSLARNKSGAIHTIAHNVLEEVVGDLFFREWEDRFSSKKLTNHVVYSDSFIDSINTTNAKLTDGNMNGVSYYYIQPSTFDVSHYFDVYDETTVYYNWSDEEIYAVEIINKNIAQSNKQLIELLIKSSEKPKTWLEVLRSSSQL